MRVPRLLVAAVLCASILGGLTFASSPVEARLACTGDDGDNATYKLLGDNAFDFAGNSKFAKTVCATGTDAVGSMLEWRPGWYLGSNYAGNTQTTGAVESLRFVKDTATTSYQTSLIQDMSEDSTGLYSAWRGLDSVQLAYVWGTSLNAGTVTGEVVVGMTGITANGVLSPDAFFAVAPFTLVSNGVGAPGQLAIPRSSFVVYTATAGDPAGATQTLADTGTISQATASFHTPPPPFLPSPAG